MNRYSKYCKPSLNHGIYAMGLDKVFHKAEAGTLYYFDEQGNEQPVIDLLGGYGAALIGHNHPKMTATAIQNFENKSPFHNQFSIRDAASELAERVNELLKDEINTNEDFLFSFTSTGAESIEVAVKHAEMARRSQMVEINKDAEFGLSEIRRLADSASFTVPGEVKALLQLNDDATHQELAEAIMVHNHTQLARQPYFVVLKHAFHGKLMTSIQLTHGEMYRGPFAHLGVQAEFIAADDLITQAEKLAVKYQSQLIMPSIKGERVRLNIEPQRLATAILVEPVQGEGGVYCLTHDHAKALRQVANLLNCPLVSDEIQSGSGRCGTLLAGTQIDLQPDYIVLSKALGGGVSKLGLVAIRHSQYLQGFDIIQSSTFGEDDHSARVGLAFLDELYNDGAIMLNKINVLGEKIQAELRELQAAYPELISDVRGRGLLIGLEFRYDLPAHSVWLNSIMYQGFLGYMVTGYLFNNYHVRVAPSSSAPNVVRIEPTIHMSESDLYVLMAGLKEVCDILRKQDSYAFLRHLTIHAESRNKRSEPQDYRDFYKDIKANQVEPDVKVAFVNHLISADWLWQVDPAMEGMPEAEAKLLVERLGFDWRVAPFPPMRVTSKLGVTADFTLYPLSVTSEEISYMLANNELTHIRNAVSDRAQAAQKDGCKVAGFGMFTSVVTNNCKSVRATDIGLTSGNALTVGMTKLAVIEEVKKQNIQLSKVAVIGSAGNIGSIYAAVISDQCEQLLLIGSGRMGSLKRLKKAAIKVYNEVWEAVVQGQNMGLASVLLRNPTCQAWLTHPQDLPDSVGEALFELFEGQDIAPILLGDDIEAVYDSPLIVCATNASETILEVEKIRENAIICDVSIPHNLSDDDLATRPDLTCIRGGVVSTPHNESLDGRARAYLDQGQVYACMAESIILGLEGEYDHYSYGDLSKSNVDRILTLAEKHGFSLAGSKNRGSM